MSLLSSFKKIATISSTSLCLSIVATWISKSSVEAQVVDANYFTHQSSINLVSNQSNKNIIWLTSNNNLPVELFASNSPSETQKSHILLFGLVILGISVTAWEVKFNFFGVTPSQALKLIYYRLPHYQNQLRITKLEAQLSLLENNFQAQLQQQLEERQKSWRSQYSTYFQQLQNQIQHIENQLASLQIEERVNSLFANHSNVLQQQIEEQVNSLFTNHSNVLQQQLEDSLNRWRSQHTGELKQLHNQIEYIKNKPVVLESEWRNTRNFLKKLKLDWAIESINEDREILFDAFDDLEKVFINIETKVNSLEKEVNNCENNIANFYKNYQNSKITNEAEGSTKTKFNTVSDVLSEAERQYPILEIFNSAKSSAKKPHYRNSEQLIQIYLAFKDIAEVGKKYFQDESIGHSLEKEFENKGFASNYRYRATESKETRNKYGKERKFCHCGRCVQIFQHLTFKNNGSLQIYFEFEKEKVIIGYCGNHLPIASH